MGRQKTIEQLQKEQEKIAAQIQMAKARQRKRARKQRNHALMIYGGMVEEALGQWNTFDPAELRNLLLANADALKENTALDYDLDNDQFTRALRQWEREQADWRRAGKSYEPRGFAEIAEEVVEASDSTDE